MTPPEINRTQINKENAKHSTGPKTEAGKKRSSLNALRHGLTSQIVVMPTEDLDAYRSHVKSFNDEYHPQGATEAHLVQALADASWRLNRVAALETNVLTLSLARHAGDLADAPPEVQDALAVAASWQIARPVDPARRNALERNSACRRAGRRRVQQSARRRNRAPRPRAGECDADPGRPGENSGLRPRQADPKPSI